MMQSWEKLQEKKDVCRSLIQDIKVLVTPDEPDKSQGPDLREQLADGGRLAEHQVNRLSPVPEIAEEEDEGDTYEEMEKVQESAAPRQYKPLIRSGTKELTELWAKLREKKDVCRSLIQDIKVLITPDEPDKSQGSELREELADGGRLAEHQVNRLSPGGQIVSRIQRQYKPLIRSGTKELTELWAKLREKKDVCRSLIQDIKVLVTPDEPDKSQGPDLREQLADGGRLAEHQVNRLSPVHIGLTVLPVGEVGNISIDASVVPEIAEEEDAGDTYEEMEKVQESAAPRQYKPLIRSGTKELTELWAKLREKKDVCRSLIQDIKVLVTPDEPDKSQGPDLREQLADGGRLAEHQVNRLSPVHIGLTVLPVGEVGNISIDASVVPEIAEEEDEGDTYEEMEKVQESAAPRQYKPLIRSGTKERTELWAKLREKKDVRRSLIQDIKVLVNPDEPDKSQGPDLREQLADGGRLAEHQVNRLSTVHIGLTVLPVGEVGNISIDASVVPEIAEEEDAGDTYEEMEKVQESAAPRSSPSYGRLREKKDVRRSLIQDIKVLVTPDEPDKSQGPDLREQLADGGRLAEHQVNRLSPVHIGLTVLPVGEVGNISIDASVVPEIAEEEDEGDTYEEMEKVQESAAPRQYKPLIRSGAKGADPVLGEVMEKKDVRRSLIQDIKVLVTPDEPDKSQGPDLREQLADGGRLAEHQVNRLSPVPEIAEEEDEGDTYEEMEKVQESAAPREVQKAEEKEVPEDSLEERTVPCSNSDGPSDSIQPLSSAKVTFVEDNVDSALIVENESSPDKWEDTLNIL
ncbi:putative neuroblastoma breakpoint family member 7, partial [Plecturocebus cupreus]